MIGGGGAVNLAEAVGEGFAGWIVSALAEFTVGFVRDNVPLGKKKHIVRNRVYTLVRSNSRKVQDALTTILSKHTELNLAVSLVNEALTFTEPPVTAGYLDINDPGYQYEAPEPGEEIISKDALDRFKKALDVSREVQLETADPATKIEALRIRLFVTYVIYTSQPHDYTTSTVLKLLCNCFKEAVDVNSSEASGLAGTLSVLNRQHFAKKFLGISKQEKDIVKDVRKLALTTLSQITWLIRKRQFVLTDSDYSLIEQCFFKPAGFSDKEVKKSWQSYILRWDDIIEASGPNRLITIFRDEILTQLKNELNKRYSKTQKLSYDFDAVVSCAYPDPKYDHSFSFYMVVIARCENNSKNDYLIVVAFERVYIYPHALGIKWIFVDICPCAPQTAYFDVDENAFMIVMDKKAISLQYQAGTIKARVVKPNLEGIQVVKNCGNKLFAVVKDSDGKHMTYTKIPGEEWSQGPEFELETNKNVFMMRQINEQPILGHLAAQLACQKVGSLTASAPILIDNVCNVPSSAAVLATYSKYLKSIVTFAKDTGELMYNVIEVTQHDHEKTGKINCEHGTGEATDLFPVGPESAIVMKNPLSLVFIDLSRHSIESIS